MHTPHTIQVWGIVAFILVRSFHNLLTDKRKPTPHFLFIIITAIGVETDKDQTNTMKKLLLLLVVSLAVCSCATLKNTSTHRVVSVNQPVTSPVIADLEISDEKIVYAMTPSIAVRNGGEQNVINTAVKEALYANGNADVMVGLEYQIKYSPLKKIMSIVITGYPAKYKNFRNLEESQWLDNDKFVIVEPVRRGKFGKR